MTKPSGDPRTRLVERTGARQTDENRAAALLRGTSVPRDPTGAELVRIARGGPSRAGGQRRARRGLRVALVISCTVAGAATVEAYEFARRMVRSSKSAPASAARLPERAVVHAEATRPELPMAEDRPPVRELAPMRPPLVASTPPIAPPPAARGSAPLPAVSDEVHELDQAMGYLRRDHNPVAALATLDHYLARHPQGTLHQEARQARIDALLMLGRNQEALTALEATSFDPGLRSTEFLVVRAELRATRDCRRAEQDFTAAIVHSPDARLMERILYGRGVCRIEMQDVAGASDDARSYLRLFPNGIHSDWARRWRASQGATERAR